MAKKKKEIKKRKKQIGEVEADAGLQAKGSEGFEADSGIERPEVFDADEAPVSEETVEDSQIVSGPAPSAGKASAKARKRPAREPSTSERSESWFNQNKENFLLGLLILYVLLLGLGTVGELFEIEWILNLPLFR